MSDQDEIRNRLTTAGPDEAGLARLTAAATSAAVAADVVDVHWAEHDLPTGTVTLAATERGLVGVWLRDGDDLVETAARRISPRILRSARHLDDPRRQLDEYFEGIRTTFDLELDWRLTDGYRREVLESLRDVQYGHTVSYLDLARRTGRPKASRAVGSAMATNPLPIVVPCHRVLRTGGGLGGYAGGVDMKRALLALEGATLV